MIKRHKVIKAITIISLIITMVSGLVNFVVPLIKFNQFNMNLASASSVGVIGGADGPTSVFIVGERPYHIIAIIFGVISVIGMIYLLVHKYLKK